MRLSVTLLAGAACALLACGTTKLKKTLPPNVHVDTYVQAGAAAVDVLWIVDDSGSMAPYQANLAQNFDSFIKIFTRGSIDYRIAVTTTDIFHIQGKCVCGTNACADPDAIISPQSPNIVGSFETNIKVGTQGSANSEGLAAAQLALDTQNQNNAAILPQLQACQT